MIGTPMPCGVLIARRSHLERVATAIAYLRSNDTTLMGSRNGHAVLAIWARLLGHGFEGYRRDATGSYLRAQQLAATLRSQGIPVLHNPYSLTVVFPEPSDDIVRLYQLACNAGEAHAVIMPNIGDAQLAQFEKHYRGWWESHRAARGRPEAVRN
jgi:histidine decarboxylase